MNFNTDWIGRMQHPRAAYRLLIECFFVLLCGAPFCAAAAQSEAALVARQNGSAAPLNFESAVNTSDATHERAIFRYEGQDGDLSFLWERPRLSTDAPLGNITLTAKPKGGRGVHMTWKGTKIGWIGKAQFLASQWSKVAGKPVLTIRYEVGHTPVNLILTPHIEAKALVVDMIADKPLIGVLDAGNWVGANGPRKITVPYDPFDVSYYEDEKIFSSPYFDWTWGQATRHIALRTVYDAWTNGRRNTLQDRLILASSWHLDEVFPNQFHAPSKYIKSLAGRLVLDLWDRGSFDSITYGIETLKGFGLHDCSIIVHDWQKYGYDNGLPSHYPASASYGGDGALKALVDSGNSAGCVVALHENYSDYYPNSDGYDAKNVARTTGGKPILSWYNRSTKTQSYALKPSLWTEMARTQSSEIHRRYDTTAAYLDVNSAAEPWSHVDMQAGDPGKSMFVRNEAFNEQLWAFLGAAHKGPVFGEGHFTFFYAGALDGVEAQVFSADTHDVVQLPLLVDFDLLRIQPLMVNHGMGYYERWADARVDMGRPELADAYRMQEVAFCHAPFVSSPWWRDAVFSLSEAFLIGPVNGRIAAAKVSDIRYDAGLGWIPTDEAARQYNFTRVKIEYGNQVTVVANSSKDPLIYRGFSLPQYGWLVSSGDFLAYTALRDGIIVDYASSSDALFVNARNSADYSPQLLNIAKLTQTGLARLNVSGKIVNFGDVKTDGIFQIRREGASWILRPLNRERSFTVALAKARFPAPKSIETAKGSLAPADDGEYWRLPINGSAEYRWK